MSSNNVMSRDHSISVDELENHPLEVRDRLLRGELLYLHHEGSAIAKLAPPTDIEAQALLAKEDQL